MELDKQKKIKLYTDLVKARKCDEYAINALKEGRFFIFYHSCQVQEAVGVGVTNCLRDTDYLYLTHRGHGLPYLVPRGVSIKRFFAEHRGKSTGLCGGFSGFHSIDIEKGILGYAGIIGSCFTFSAGFAFAAKLRGEGQVAVCDFGDGHSNRGQFHEAMNLSALWKLPVIWVCENNQMAMMVPVTSSYPLNDIAELAAGYGIPGVVVDGQDVIAVYEAATAAVDRARAGDGPTLLEFKTFRIRPHTEGIPDCVHSQIRSQEEIDYWKTQRDPIKLFENRLLKEGILTDKDIKKIHKKIDEELEEVEKFISESPDPDLSTIDLDKRLFAD